MMAQMNRTHAARVLVGSKYNAGTVLYTTTRHFAPDHNDDFVGLQVHYSEGIAGQIDDMRTALSSAKMTKCDAAEMTREDLYVMASIEYRLPIMLEDLYVMASIEYRLPVLLEDLYVMASIEYRLPVMLEDLYMMASIEYRLPVMLDKIDLR
jgi:hypothetical protein